MAAPEIPDAPPPEVPEEFADAYREAYRRALESGDGFDEQLQPDPHSGFPEVPPHEVVRVGTHRSEAAASAPALADWRSSRWFLPAVIGASGLVLVLAAYAVGKVVSNGDDEPAAAQQTTGSTTMPHTSPSTHTKPPSTAAPSTAPGGWEGAVSAVPVNAISADCTSPPGRDSAGRKVTYVPGKAIDDKADTAWRCNGTAVGQKLTLRMGTDVDVAEVGLVPGYAKTDPESGVDRYAENNRISRVRWTLGDGESIVQRLDTDRSSRAVQLLRVPRTTTDTITLEILAVTRGPRNTTAISDIQVLAAD
jgi:hypothetical protein